MPRAEPSRTRFGLWITACALCTAAGFGLGRLVPAPAFSSDKPAPVAVAPLRAESDGPVRRADATTASEGLDVIAVAHASTDARRRSLIALLQTLNNHDAPEDLGAIFKLATWIQVSGEDDLAEALALGAEITKGAERSRLDELLPIMVFTRWGALNGPAAMEAYLEQPTDSRNTEARAALFKAWASEGNPQDAIDHALAMRRTSPEELEIDRDLLGELLVDWDRRDPTSALASARLLAKSTDEEERAAGRRLAEKVAVRTMQTKGASAALQWIDQWPHAADRDSLRLELLDQRETNSDPLAAPQQGDPSAAEIIARIESGATLGDSGYLRAHASRLANYDVEAARRWCATLSPAAKSTAAGQIAGKLAQTGHWREAVSWIETQTANPEIIADVYHDAAEAAAAQGSLASALALTERVADASDSPEDIAARRTDLLTAWLRSDPTRAEFLLRQATANESAAVPPAP